MEARTAEPSELPAPPLSPRSRARGRILLAVKLAVAAAALAYTFWRLKPDEVLAAARRLSLQSVVLAAALCLMNLMLATVRWRILLAAYGAERPPRLAFLARAQLVGHFYNTFVPGNVTGDAVRGHATRRSFDTPLGSYMVVGLERFFGLAGLATVGAVGLLQHPLPGVSAAALAALAFAMAFVIALVPIVGRRVGAFLPGRLGAWARALPAVGRPGLLGIVLALSLLTQTMVGVTCYVILHVIAPQVAASDAVVLAPLAMGAVYVPSVGGLGVREASFVFFFSKIGVSNGDAIASSLAVFVVYALVAGLGGLVHLVRPLRSESERRGPQVPAS